MGVLQWIFYMLWRGLAIGVIISAPMGPVGILCVQRTLSKGRKAGFYTGVGAAISDLFYCLLTGFGLSFIEEFLQENQNVIQLCGSVVLIAFGVYLFMSNPSRCISKPGEDAGSPKRDIINGFLFTVSNPLIIFLIIGLFARFNFLLPEITFYEYIVGFLFIIIGALGWWWIVTYGVDKVRAHFNLRSMWLINKITGSIIMLFGIVGIVTSIVGLANATEPHYWNSGRGFGSLTDSHVLLAGHQRPVKIPLDNREFTFEFRSRNLNNQAGRSYDGIRHPAWTLTAVNPTHNDSVCITFKTIDDVRDPMGPQSLGITVTRNGEVLAQNGMRDHVDWFTGWNSWRLARSGNKWSLYGGEREYNPIVEWQLLMAPAELRFATEPAGMMELDWMKLTCADRKLEDVFYGTDINDLNDYFSRSTDPVEGIWQMYDRALDESNVRPGGEYRLALIANNDDGYDLVYLDGAEKNVNTWQPGMVKGVLKPTPFRNVFNIKWRDADGNPIQSEVKAEFQTPDILAVQMPYLNSSFRLRKTE